MNEVTQTAENVAGAQIADGASFTMLPFGQLIFQAAALIVRFPVLALPPLIAAVAARYMVGGPQGLDPLGAVSFGLFNVALTTGLLALVRSSYAGEKPGWEIFFVAVGRHYVQVLAGTMVLVVLALMTLYPVVLGLSVFVGAIDTNLLAHPAAFSSAIPPAQTAILARWMVGLGAWGMLWVLLAFFLLLWKQAVVVTAMPWLRAWRASITFVRSHWPRLVGVLIIQGVLLAGGFLLVSQQHLPALGELGVLVLLIANLFFTVVLTLAYMGARPPGQSVDSEA